MKLQGALRGEKRASRVERFRFMVLRDSKQWYKKNVNGFTLLELLITLVIIGITIIGSISMYGRLQVSAQLNEQTTKVISALRTAQMRALTGIGGEPHGVYVNANPTGTDSLIVFQGTSYASRLQDADLIENFPDSVSLAFQLSTTTQEIIFSRPAGIPSATGSVSITLEGIGSRTVTVNTLGLVEESE